MGCFVVPAVEAAVTTITAKVLKSKESRMESVNVKLDGEICEAAGKIRFSEKLGWLNKLLWGGTALLAFEHVWHGEVTPWAPFLTAASDPESTVLLLKEMSTVGVGMAVIVTAAWAGMVVLSSVMEKKTQTEQTAQAKQVQQVQPSEG